MSCALLVGVLVGATEAQASNVDALEVQTLPRHMQQVAYSHELKGASPDYVMHNVHDLPWADGHDHFTVIRADDGSTAWTDFDADPDSRAVSLVGRYVTEKIGDSTNWPDSVRFRDVETHQVAGEIALPGQETLRAIGPGWLLSTRPSGSAGVLDSVLVIHRLDGSTDVLDNVPVNWSAVYAGSDGDIAWVRDGYGGPLFQVDVATGDVTVVPRPDGVQWAGLLIGPTKLFNLEDQYNGHVHVTTVDRVTGAATTYDLAISLGGNVPIFLTRGDGLAAYEPYQAGGATLYDLDLPAGTVGAPIQDHVSQGRQMSPGTVALVVDAAAPGTIKVDRGEGPTPLADFPPVSEGTARLAYDGSVRSTWGDDTTWSIDPDQAEAGWTQTPWTPSQVVTTSGGTTLVNDLDESNRPTSHWHMTWPGGQRDVEGAGLVLGHGGELLVRRASADPYTFEVERVRTGEVVATANATGVVADGSRIWRTPTPGVLTGVDVDHPGDPTVSIPVNIHGRNATVIDVRGRWALMAAGIPAVVDTLSVVPTFTPPGDYTPPAQPRLGNGFVVTSTWTYDAYNHVNGYRTVVTDLSPAHASRDLVDPDSGKVSTWFAVDEAGSRSLAYVSPGGLPKVVRLPWLQDAPLTLPDTIAPVLATSTAPNPLVRSTTGVASTFTWDWADEGTAGAPASGIASHEVRYRMRSGYAAYSTWTTTNSPQGSRATLTRIVQPGTELCAQSRATDNAENTSTWSEELCTRVDGSAPVLAPATGAPRFVALDPFEALHYSYSATDDDGVASYDVQARTAAPGANLGSWTSLRYNTTNRSLEQTAGPGSEWCFRFRARDTAGNLSAWSLPRCSSVAMQDDTFISPGDSRRLQSGLATDGWYIRLGYPKARLRLPRAQVGRTVAIWLIVGPGQGVADVYTGGVHAGSVGLSAKSTHLRLVTMSVRRNGYVKIVQHDSRPIRIDAIAIER